MDEFGIYLCIGILVFIFITIKSRFNKIDSNLSVLNRKLEQIIKNGIPTIPIVSEKKVSEEYKPAIPIISIIPVFEKKEEIKPVEP